MARDPTGWPLATCLQLKAQQTHCTAALLLWLPQDKVALLQDPTGWPWQLLELHGAAAAERLCTVSLRVTNLAASLRWYQDVLGMRVLQKYEAPGTGGRVGFDLLTIVVWGMG
jgi:hypothetical protein